MLDCRLESIARRKRADSFLRSLNPEQSRQVYKWIRELESIDDVHDRITAPPPEGLGLKVSVITLRRLRSYWHACDEVSFTENMLDIITDMEVDSELKQPARIQNAICHLLQQKAFDLARTYPGSDVMKDVLTGIEKLTTLDLKRQKLQLERERILRKTTTPAIPPSAPATHQQIQHHRVDLNIVPPNPINSRQPLREPAIIVSVDPEPTHKPQQLPSPKP